jgi:ATP-dependent Zn protease
MMLDIETAYHEAGHAVLGCLLGRIPLSVTIVPRGPVVGETFFDTEVPAFARSYFNQSAAKRSYTEQRVLTELGGTAAHDILMPGRQHDVADETDLYYTRQLIIELVSMAEDRDAYLVASQKRATELLQANWPWVEAVARALVERKTLQRTDLLALRPKEAAT